MKNSNDWASSVTPMFIIVSVIKVFAACGDLSQATDAAANAKMGAPDYHTSPVPSATPSASPTPRNSLTISNVFNLSYWRLNGGVVGSGVLTAATYCVSFEFVH